MGMAGDVTSDPLTAGNVSWSLMGWLARAARRSGSGGCSPDLSWGWLAMSVPKGEAPANTS